MRQSERIKGLGLALGFDRVGIADANSADHAGFLREWLAKGFAGDMHYLARRAEERIDPTRVLPGARSIIAVAIQYHTPVSPEDDKGGARSGQVARYAGGPDYHEVLIERLEMLGRALELSEKTPVRWKAYVDTGPVLEKAVAARAGLGWIGKNTCLIDSRLGSYLFLGVLLSDVALVPDAASVDHCGSCRACLDACPTDAFPEAYVLDASRCLAYTTIELRGAIPEPLRGAQDTWVFGCDICQEVCPWNKRREHRETGVRSPLSLRLQPTASWIRPSLAWLLSLDERAWRDAVRGTALRRAKFAGLLRNALVAAGNTGDPALRAAVERHQHATDPVIADHARWALARLGDSS